MELGFGFDTGLNPHFTYACSAMIVGIRRMMNQTDELMEMLENPVFWGFFLGLPALACTLAWIWVGIWIYPF